MFSSDMSTGAAGPVAGRLRGGTVKPKDPPNINGTPNKHNERNKTHQCTICIVMPVMAATWLRYVK
jgi:hypothetical protein